VGQFLRFRVQLAQVVGELIQLRVELLALQVCRFESLQEAAKV
jgi:hypothetical protein